MESTKLPGLPLPSLLTKQSIAVITSSSQKPQVAPPQKPLKQKPCSLTSKTQLVSSLKSVLTTSTVLVTIQPPSHSTPLPVKPLTTVMMPRLVFLNTPKSMVLSKPKPTAMEVLKLLLWPLLPPLLFPSPWSDPAQM